jgi:hypothetical protein
MTAANELLSAALQYAKRGWLVLPLHSPAMGRCSCSKPSCASIGKHPRTRSGLDDATTNATVIKGWWTNWPNANVGIVTGRESGLLVLDVDDKGSKRGSDALAALTAAQGGDTATMTVRTGCGTHLYFRHPGMDVCNSVQRLGDGLDVRGERGYVVAAPSIHTNGGQYVIENPCARPTLPILHGIVSATPSQAVW